MAGRVNFELVSPDRILVSDTFDMIVIPGGDGDIGVLPDHAPLISTIRPGVIDIHADGKVAHQVFVAGGFAEVLPDRCTVLAEKALMVASIDVDDTRARIEATELDLRDAESDAERDRARSELRALNAMLEAVPDS